MTILQLTLVRWTNLMTPLDVRPVSLVMPFHLILPSQQSLLTTPQHG
jgi:hypothetical protein